MQYCLLHWLAVACFYCCQFLSIDCCSVKVSVVSNSIAGCLYMPSMGFCLLVAYGWHCLHQRVSSTQRRGFFRRFLRLAPVASFAVLCLLFGAKTITRNWDWADEYSIFSAGLRYGIILVFFVRTHLDF